MDDISSSPPRWFVWTGPKVRGGFLLTNSTKFEVRQLRDFVLIGWLHERARLLSDHPFSLSLFSNLGPLKIRQRDKKKAKQRPTKSMDGWMTREINDLHVDLPQLAGDRRFLFLLFCPNHHFGGCKWSLIGCLACCRHHAFQRGQYRSIGI